MTDTETETAPAETVPAAETKILTASTVELELPAAAETAQSRPPAELPPATTLAGEMVREETVASAPVEEAAAAQAQRGVGLRSARACTGGSRRADVRPG